MKNHHEVVYFKNRLMIGLLSLFVLTVMAGQSFAATTCSTCHGIPPLDSVDGSRVPATGAFKGSHQKHLGVTATVADCTKCHGNVDYTSDHATASANKIHINSPINGSPLAGNYSKGVLFNQTSVPVLGSCSNVNCHFERNLTDRTPAPVWGEKPSVDCNFCHATPRVASGSHEVHQSWLGDTAPGDTASCSQCHPAYSTFNHATSAGKAKIKVNAGNIYSGGTPTSWLPSQPKSFGSCSAASCHADVYSTTGFTPTPQWGSTGHDCSICHTTAIGTNGPATGAHNAHAGKACDVCHATGTTATSAPSRSNGHIDGNIDIYYYNYPANVGKHAAGSYAGTCSTAYCHSNGKGTYSSPTWGGTSNGCRFCHPTLSAGHDIHLADLFDAGSPVTFYGYTSTTSSGGNYRFGCSICHPTAISSHINNTVDVDMTANANGGHLKANNAVGAAIDGAKQCLNIYCHSNGYSTTKVYATTPAWGGSFAGDRCANCHGNSPGVNITGSTAHSAHTVGIHFSDIFNGVSKKLADSGASTVNAAHGANNRSTTINCNICHSATVTTFANDQNEACKGCHGTFAPLKNPASRMGNTANHVNGNVDVVFINQKIATKAQVANAAFAAYTAKSSGWVRNSNGMQFKTYTSSYDYTKSTLFAAASSYTPASGCLNIACHSSITVKWTDTVTCTSCHTRLK